MASSSFFSSTPDDNSPRPISVPDPIIVDFSDERLIAENIVKADALRDINMAHISENVELEDIIQGKVGNCYLLAALNTLVETYPELLKNIIVYKNNKFHVTLYDAKNPEQAYIYILDPTKVVGSNQHKHDLVFILEKAYALHRIRLEPLSLSDEEIKIRDIYYQCKKDFRSTLQAYKAEEQERKLKILPLIEKEMLALQQKLLDNPAFEASITDPKTQLLLHFLKDHDSINEAARAYIANQFPTNEDISVQIKNAIKKFKDERIDYESGLTSGDSDAAFKALLGTDVVIQTFFVPTFYTIANILMELLPEIANVDPQDFSGKVKEFLKSMFKDDKLAQDYFISSIKHTNIETFFEIAMEYQAKKNKTTSNRAFFRKFFQENINWGANPTQFEITQKLIENFIVNNISSKRGLGVYTSVQQEIFTRIQTALSEGNLVTCSTLQKLSLNPTPKKIGVVEEHMYFVANAFERGNLKFLELRNPWTHTVREYTFKRKTLDGAETQVLTAEEKKQLSPLLQARALNLLGRTSPRLLERKNAAKSRSQPPNTGFFEIDIIDFEKFTSDYTIAIVKPAKRIMHQPKNHK